MNPILNSDLLLNLLLPEFLNSGNTGPGLGGKTCYEPGLGGKTCYLLLGFKGKE